MSDAHQCITPGCVNGGPTHLGGSCSECKELADRFEQEAGPTSAPSFDSVNHPQHYTFGKFEVIDVIEDWNLNYSRSCVIKYVARAGRKNDELEDLRKAAFYLQREIARLEAKQP